MPSPSTYPFATLAIGCAVIGMSTVLAFTKPANIRRSKCSYPRRHPTTGVRRLRYQLSQQPLQPKTSSIRGRRDEEECLLIPEPNPNFNANTTSLSGVLISQVISGIDALYPPYELSTRNARSRTEGYWKYVERGEQPPQELTYGEFDIDFFGILLDKSWKYVLEMEASSTSDDDDLGAYEQLHRVEKTTSSPWENRTFCDIGSGAGRLVLAAAALHPAWKLCRGIEVLSGLHNMAVSIVNSNCQRLEEEYAMARHKQGINNDDHALALHIPYNNQSNDDAIPSRLSTNATKYLPLAPIQFTCGSFTDPYEYLGDIDCAFVFSSCMKPEIVQDLSEAIGRQCKPGTIVITTEFPLFLHGSVERLDSDSSMPYGLYEIELLEKIDGWCWLLGGESTAYIHRVKKSFWEDYAGPRRKPQNSLEEEAFNLVQLIENGTLTDTKDFLRRVRNDMIFHDLPNEFIPDVD